MKAFDFFVGLLFSIIFLSACAKQQATVQESPRASNRVMGLFVSTDDNLKTQRTAFESHFSKSLQEAYFPQIKIINLPAGPFPDEGENMYEIARNQVDDLFIFKLAQKDQMILVAGSIISGSNLKTINRISLSFSIDPSPDRPDEVKMSFQTRFVNQMKKSLLSAYPNPNVYPSYQPYYFADAIYAKAQMDEKNAGAEITCENASQALSLYSKAKEIYELGQKRSLVKAYGSQAEQHQITTRLQDSEEKGKIVELCAKDADRKFGVQWSFGTIDPSNHPAILQAAENVGLNEILQKYTDKPVELQMSADASGEINLNVILRFDSRRFMEWTKSRVPERYRNFGVLSLDPYYALMQKLVFFKHSLPDSASPALKQGFGLMKMNIILRTILNGEVMFGASGVYNAQENKVSLAYPASISIQAPGFERKTVMNKDQELFQEKTWIALGSCKTLEGNMTEDGLVYRFFGIKCP